MGASAANLRAAPAPTLAARAIWWSDRASGRSGAATPGAAEMAELPVLDDPGPTWAEPTPVLAIHGLRDGVWSMRQAHHQVLLFPPVHLSQPGTFLDGFHVAAPAQVVAIDVLGGASSDDQAVSVQVLARIPHRPQAVSVVVQVEPRLDSDVADGVWSIDPGTPLVTVLAGCTRRPLPCRIIPIRRGPYRGRGAVERPKPDAANVRRAASSRGPNERPTTPAASAVRRRIRTTVRGCGLGRLLLRDALAATPGWRDRPSRRRVRPCSGPPRSPH